VPLAQVAEIMRCLPIEAMAGAPPFILGLCLIRGLPVAVVDTGRLAGLAATRSERLITIRVGSRMIALAVESVLGVRAIAPEAAKELPPLLRDAAGAAIAAIGTLDAELLLYLSAARSVPEALLDSLAAGAAA
jgi:purine-binding chemotaxis protein CheW